MYEENKLKYNCYLDTAASSIPSKEVIDFFDIYMKNIYANPSSIHDPGLNARRILESSKRSFLDFLNGYKNDELIFTSCASESNSIGIQGLLRANKNYQLIVSRIEHEDILMLCDWVNETEFYNKVEYIDVDSDGFIKLNQLKYLCKKAVDKHKIPLVVIQGANSEIGVIQDLKQISYITHIFDGILFSDITQLLANSKVDVKKLGIDLCSASSQKLNCFKGAGFLYIKEGIKLQSIIFGNQGLRGGTPNVPMIGCFEKAIQSLKYDLELRIKRDWLINELLSIKGISLNGSPNKRLDNNINICIRDISINATQLVMLLSMNGFYVSAGSACSSYENKPSHVLTAIGLEDENATKSIRISINKLTTYEDLNSFIDCLKKIILIYKK